MARTYNEDEVAAILAVAAKRGAEREAGAGVTLAELEAAAREAGLDGALVRDAARGVDRVEEAPRGLRRYGASTRLAARVTVDGPVDLDALAGRLFADMVERVGDPGQQREVGDARVWQTRCFGQGLDAGPGPQLSVTLRPAGDGAALVLREDVDREAARGVGIRTVAAGLIGGFLTFLVGDALGPVDDAIFLAVISTPLHGALGWLAGKAWWRRNRRRLAAEHEARLRALAANASELASLPASDEES